MEKQLKKIWTVTELNSAIKDMIEPNFEDIWLEGEVSNYKLYSSGHAYFTLKDESSQISAVMFDFVGLTQGKFKLEDGLKVIARGRVTLYVKSGKHQIVVSYIEPKGKGALQLAFEQLKLKLQREGLFDPSHKKPIPLLPQKIGVVTSPTGAAIRDILTVINRRFANVHILIYPVAVQGENAKFEISEAIYELNQNFPDIDVMLVGRGGGSYEDLWAFNEEIVARAIYASKIPVISCVGHEIDFTIADFVADLRAPTPSAAAELVVKNKEDLKVRLKHLYTVLYSTLSEKISIYEQKLKHLSANTYLKNPFEYFSDVAQTLDILTEKLFNTLNYMLQQKTHSLEILKNKLFSLSPTALITYFKIKVEELFKHLQKNVENIYLKKEQRFDFVVKSLNSLSPLNILSRGYSIVWKLPEKILLKNSKDVKSNDRIEVKLEKGSLFATVEKIEPEISDLKF